MSGLAHLAELAELGGQEAEELYREKTHMCADGVLEVLNRRLGGQLDRDQLRSLTAALSNGVGGAGCMCGALNGGLLAVGLLLGQGGAFSNRDIRAAGKALHEAFTQANGSACCRTLTKKVKSDPKAHFEHCAAITRLGAELAAGVILERRPELAAMPQAAMPRATLLARSRRKAGHAVGALLRAATRRAAKFLGSHAHGPIKKPEIS